MGNPLLYETPAHGYFRVERATEIILRAWESQDISQMPRLARWVFNAFWAAAQLGLTIADCSHFLMPGSPYHEPLLNLLPHRLKDEWQEIMTGRGQEATRILDSSRNRLKPYFESDILRRMFGGSRSKLDVLRMMREGRVVILDLSPRNRLSGPLANTIGALVLNEVLATARSLPRDVRYPTYLLLDEIQNFVGPDIEAALPEVRQLGLRLLLSHQSFSQLERGDYDLTSMIFQAQSRLIFGMQGEDADILAHEVASLKFDSRSVKDELFSRRQMTTGHRKEILSSWSNSKGNAEQWSKAYGRVEGDSRGETTRRIQDEPTVSRARQKSDSRSENKGGSTSTQSTEGGHETLVPELENFDELSSRTYFSFDEQKQELAREIRRLPTGQALLRLVNDQRLYRVNVKRSAPGFLAYDLQTIARKFPELLERMDRLVEENFQSDFFSPADDVDREIDSRMHSVLNSRIRLSVPPAESAENLPFGV